MKNVTRGALTALTLASVLGITACGPAATPSDSSSQGTASASASATPSVDPNKAEGFSSSLVPSNVPADWKNGEAVPSADDSAFVVGKYVGYIASLVSGGAASASPSTSQDDKAVQLVVIDNKGTVVYKSSKPAEGSKVINADLDRVFSNGKAYLVFTQQLTLPKDPSSTRSAESATSTLIVNDQGKEVSSQTVKGKAVVDKGVVMVTSAPNGTADQIIDVATGKLSALPTAPKDHEWYGRFDGVDIFGLTDFDSFGADGELTNGTWKIPSKASLSKTNTPTEFGSLLRVSRPTKDMTVLDDLIDPHTGKVVYGADLKDGISFESVESNRDSHGVASPNRKFVITGDDVATGNGVYSITDNKFYPIASDLNFSAISVTDEGYVYGESPNGRAGYNIVKDTEPKVLTDTSAVPSEVSESGIGIFGGYVVLKPQSK